MDSQTAVDLGRQALWMSLLIGAPVLVVGLLVGLIVGLLQALTQVQEQTVAFVPKLAAMIITLGLTLPWLIQQMVQYSQELIGGIAGRL